jgi:hypothetical protein
MIGQTNSDGTFTVWDDTQKTKQLTDTGMVEVNLQIFHGTLAQAQAILDFQNNHFSNYQALVTQKQSILDTINSLVSTPAPVNNPTA